MARALVFFCALAFVTGPLAAQPSLQSQIDSLFAPWNTAQTPGVAVTILRGGDSAYSRGYGIANLEYNIPITPETVFLVASLSKQFTAFAIALLATEGALSLEDPVRNYVPELPDYGETITIRHLIHHTSGLRDEFGLLAMAGYRMDDVITKEAVLQLLYRQQALNFDPGDAYLYCNSGYTLLAEIVERVTGQNFATWTKEHIFVPLGMHDSHFRSNHASIIKGRAEGYVTTENGYDRQVVNYASVGASGLYTTANDLARWVQNFDERVVGTEGAIDLMHERGRLSSGDTLDYAFGLSIGTYKGTRRISHSGSHRGFRTHMMRLPDADLAVVVLSNLEEFDPTAMAQQVADLFLARDLSEYAGTFYSEELVTTFHIVYTNGHLVARHRRYDDIPLTASGTDTFTGDSWFFATLTFLRQNGRITGFEASNRRTRKVRFEKR